MEPIKITDKLTLRQEALRMAMELSHNDANNIDLVKLNAISLANYLQGSAELPEYSDHDKFYTEILAKMQESFKPKPFDLWIPVGGDIKPPHDADIIGYENGSMHFCKLTKVGDEDVFVINDGCEFHPTHWMPIPIPPIGELNALGFIEH